MDSIKKQLKELEKKLKGLGAETTTILGNNISEEPEQPFDEETKSLLSQFPEGMKWIEENERNVNKRKNRPNTKS